MADDYKPERLRAASPEKCKHPVYVVKEERSYGTDYMWRHCPLCHTDFDHQAIQGW